MGDDPSAITPEELASDIQMSKDLIYYYYYYEIDSFIFFSECIIDASRNLRTCSRIQ